MGFMITFVSAYGNKIGVNSDQIIDVKKSSTGQYKSLITYGVSDKRGGVIPMKEDVEEVIDYINTGKWGSIRE